MVHLSTSRSGGAGIAAIRLHEGLKSLGIKSDFVTLYRNGFRHDENEIERNLLEKLLAKVTTWINSTLSNKTYFSVVYTNPLKKSFLTKFGGPNEVIFHVHNWFNLIRIEEIEKVLKAGYRFVFTLHDQRLFTGGCHYSIECKKFTQSCSLCPHLITPLNRIPNKKLKTSIDIFHEFKNQIQIIAPSNWIMKLAQESTVLKNNFVSYIPNWHGGLVAEVATNSNEGLMDKSNLILGVASVDKNSSIKGKLTISSLEALIRNCHSNIKVVYLSDFQRNNQSSGQFWNSIDYLIVPSIIDNSPNVIHEAKIYGVPIIATDVGGVSELLSEDYDYLVSGTDHASDEIWRIVNSVQKPIPRLVKEQIKYQYRYLTRNALHQHVKVYREFFAKNSQHN